MDNSDCNGFPGEYDSETEKYLIHYDKQSTEPISSLIVKAVAALSDTPSTELDPIYDTINSDALNNIVQSTQECTSGEDNGHVEFTYNNCQVTVFTTGLVEIDLDTDL